MSEQHTQEPWFDSDPSDDPVYEPRIFDREGMQIAHVYEWADFSIPHHERIAIQAANARRIVACVNACAGIPTEDIERAGSIACEVQDEAQAELLKARQQRDELLAALKLIAAAPDLLDALKELCEIVDDAIGQRSAKDLDSFTLQPARAAIARAQGEAK